jgi:hypothetical protein
VVVSSGAAVVAIRGGRSLLMTVASPEERLRVCVLAGLGVRGFIPAGVLNSAR